MTEILSPSPYAYLEGRTPAERQAAIRLRQHRANSDSGSSVDLARRARDYQARITEIESRIAGTAQRYSRGSVTRVALDNLALEIRGDKRWDRRYPGKKVGHINKNGYLATTIFGRHLLVHRVIWLLANGSWPGGEIDHANMDKLDNRLGNLRDSTPAENRQNRRIRSDCRHGDKGVSYIRRDNLWRATIQKDGVRINLGESKHKDAAVRLYRDAARRLHGEFARVE